MAAGALTCAGEAGVSRRGVHELLVVLSRAGRPAPGLPALRGGFVVFLFGKGWGWGREGQDPEGIGRPGELGSTLLFLTAGAVNRPISARGEPAGPALPASSAGLRGGAARGRLGAGAGRRRRERRSGGGVVGGGAGCGDGAGLGGGRGPTLRRGCPGKFDFNSLRVGGGSEVGPGWAAGRGLGTAVRRRLFRGREGLGPSWEARGAAGPWGSLLRSSNEWAPWRLRGGAELRGKTSLESRLRSHDGGRGGERDEWRKRVGDGFGVNREALPLCDRERGLAGDSSLRRPTYTAAPGRLKQNKKSRRNRQSGPGFCSCF